MNRYIVLILALLFFSCKKNSGVVTVYVRDVEEVSIDSLTGNWNIDSYGESQNMHEFLNKDYDSVSLTLKIDSTFIMNVFPVSEGDSIFFQEGKWVLEKRKKEYVIFLSKRLKLNSNRMDSIYRIMYFDGALALFSEHNPKKISTIFRKKEK